MTKEHAYAFECGYQMGREHAMEDVARGGSRSVEELEAENARLSNVVIAFLMCADDDADAHECPMYDEDAPDRCRLWETLVDLGFVGDDDE